MTVAVRIRFGHLDRMPKCKHGRVEGFCQCWDDPAKCRWCLEPVIRNVACSCDRAQEEARRIRAAR